MKILIVTETIAGKGHEKAAYSLAKAIKQNGVNSNSIIIISLLQIFNKHIEATLRFVYMLMIKRIPFLWHWMYKKETSFALFFKEAIAIIISKKIDKYLKTERPEIIIATHASGLGALSKLKAKYHYKLVAVFTDFQINNFWIHDNVDYYFVPHQDYQQQLITKNVDKQKIIISGIPIDPVFGNNIKPIRNSEEEGSNGEFNVLIMGGGLGLGGIKDVILGLKEIKEKPINITVVTGMNKTLYQELQELQSKLAFEFDLYQYVDNIYSLMVDSHLLISKPGGLTVSEALATKLPILIYKPLPGQEEKNLNFLIKNNAAILANDLFQLRYWVEYLIDNPSYYQQLIEQGQKIAKPQSANEIAQTLMALYIEKGLHENKVADN